MAMKGSVFDLIPIFLFLLIFSSVSIVAFMIWGEISSAMSGIDGFSTATATTTSTLAGFDSLFVFVTFGMILSSMVLALFVDMHPVMFIVSFILLVIITAISGVFSNVYYGLATSNGLVNAASNFPYMFQIWSNLPIISAISGFLIMIVAYAKWNSGRGI